MKRLLITVFSVFAITLSASWYFYFTLKKVIPPEPNQLVRTMDFLNTDTVNYDIVFIGSSRVYAHINPRIVDSICNVNSYCVSMDGGSITQDIIMLKKYLAHHHAPKMIVAGLDYSSLQASMLPYNYPDYYPYLVDSVFATVNSRAISRFKYSAFYQKYDAFIKYSSKTDYQKIATLSASLGVTHNFENLGGKPEWFNLMIFDKGFSPIKRSWTAESDAGLNEDWTIPTEQQGIDFLNDFVTITKQCGSKPVILFSPAYYVSKKQFKGTDKFFAAINDVAGHQAVPFLNYSDDSICYSKNYFHDVFHLNNRGAEKFSTVLASDLNKIK